jgi:hypothetical protein
MTMATAAPNQGEKLIRALIDERLGIAFLLAISFGCALAWQFPFPSDQPFLQYIGQERPFILATLRWSYTAFLFSTPFLFASMLGSLGYVHLYRSNEEMAIGSLPPYPKPSERDELFAVLGEVHQRLEAIPSKTPRWLTIPERGLYTGIAVFGSIGTGKTQGVILPLMRQLFAYKTRDTQRKLSGLVLEVKGDLCRQLASVMRECGREDDYVEVSLNSKWRYNPLQSDLDAYALAYNIASLLTNIWGKGKEPFWQQAYTDLVKYIIILHKVKDDYVTLFDVYATAISPSRLEQLLIETGARFGRTAWVVIPKDQFKACPIDLSRFRFELDGSLGAFRARLTPELEQVLLDETDVEATVYEPREVDEIKRHLFEAVDRWYWEHWRNLRSDLKTSIVQGIAVFLSLFDTDPDVKRVFCPPKEIYAGKSCASDPNGVVLPPFSQLIEDGKVCTLNFPVALNPGLARAIGTMMKQDYQRAVLLRIPQMEAHPERHWRPTVFMCDEYQNFATVGSNDPNGDERFLSLSRQPKCIPVVATQSVSSLKEALAGAGYKTLLQAFRTKVFLATSDSETARYASDLCGKTERVRINYSVSESSNDAHVGLLSGKATANRSSVSTSKTYQKQKDSLFDEKAFYSLKNAQSIALAYDGVNPLPPTYCMLKPDFLPIGMSWFEQEAMSFDPERIPA